MIYAKIYRFFKFLLQYIAAFISYVLYNQKPIKIISVHIKIHFVE